MSAPEHTTHWDFFWMGNSLLLIQDESGESHDFVKLPTGLPLNVVFVDFDVTTEVADRGPASARSQHRILFAVNDSSGNSCALHGFYI